MRGCKTGERREKCTVGVWGEYDSGQGCAERSGVSRSPLMHRAAKCPPRFTVAEVFESFPACKLSGNLVGVSFCLDAVQEPVGAQVLFEYESVAVDADYPRGPETLGLCEADGIAVDGRL